MAGRSLRYPPSSGLRASLASHPVLRVEIGLLAGAPQVRFVEATEGQVAGGGGRCGQVEKVGASGGKHRRCFPRFVPTVAKQFSSCPST